MPLRTFFYGFFLSILCVASLSASSACETVSKNISLRIRSVSDMVCDTSIVESISSMDMTEAYTNGYYVIQNTGTVTVSQNEPWEITVKSAGSFDDGGTGLEQDDFSVRVVSALDGTIVATAHGANTSFIGSSTSIMLIEDSNSGTGNNDIVLEYKINNIDDTINQGTVTLNVMYTLSEYTS